MTYQKYETNSINKYYPTWGKGITNIIANCLLRVCFLNINICIYSLLHCILIIDFKCINISGIVFFSFYHLIWLLIYFAIINISQQNRIITRLSHAPQNIRTQNIVFGYLHKNGAVKDSNIALFLHLLERNWLKTQLQYRWRKM